MDGEHTVNDERTATGRRMLRWAGRPPASGTLTNTRLDALEAHYAPADRSAELAAVLAEGDEIEIEVPDEVTEATVAAVVTPHNPSAIDAAIVAAQQELSGWRATLQSYIDAPTPTNVQTVGVVKLMCRAILRAAIVR